MTRARVPLPEQDYLKSTFEYCTETGQLYWSKNRPKTDFLTDRSYNSYIKNLVGTVAGYRAKPAKYSKEIEGYWKVVLCGKSYMIHRIIYKMFTGLEPNIIDHSNNIHTDNRIENLKESTRQENKMKSPKVYNSSGYRGVVRRRDRSSYEIRVSLPTNLGGKSVHVGYYKNIEEAAQAYNIALSVYYKDIEKYLNNTTFSIYDVDLNKSVFTSPTISQEILLSRG